MSSVGTDLGSRKRTLSCSTTATAQSTASSYTSYNLDESDADHMAYLESRYTEHGSRTRDMKIMFSFIPNLAL